MCVHKKFGTMLFCKDGDLLTSLSWALGTNLEVEVVTDMDNFLFEGIDLV